MRAPQMTDKSTNAVVWNSSKHHTRAHWLDSVGGTAQVQQYVERKNNTDFFIAVLFYVQA